MVNVIVIFVTVMVCACVWQYRVLCSAIVFVHHVIKVEIYV